MRGIFFDAAGTLIRVEPSVGHVYAAAAVPFGVMADPRELNRAFDAQWQRRRGPNPAPPPFDSNDETEKAWWHELVSDAFEMAARRSQFNGRFDEYFEQLYEHFAGAAPWRIYEDVVPALDAFRKAGLRMAVVSNFDGRLPRLLEALELTPYFETILTSAAAGRRKPDPAPFQKALAHMDLPPEAVVHVGDNLLEDVAGAEAAGITPVLIDRGQQRRSPVQTIREMTQLAAVLDQFD